VLLVRSSPGKHPLPAFQESQCSRDGCIMNMMRHYRLGHDPVAANMDTTIRLLVDWVA
jgi:hypothetical protein